MRFIRQEGCLSRRTTSKNNNNKEQWITWQSRLSDPQNLHLGEYCKSRKQETSGFDGSRWFAATTPWRRRRSGEAFINLLTDPFISCCCNLGQHMFRDGLLSQSKSSQEQSERLVSRMTSVLPAVMDKQQKILNVVQSILPQPQLTENNFTCRNERLGDHQIAWLVCLSYILR